jgi:hypothetical protein
MNKLLIGLSVVALSLITSIAVVEMNKPKTEQSLESVAQSNEYRATPLKAGATQGAVIKSTPGALGSVVITGAQAGVITIYNATTTNVNFRAGATSTLPVLASIPASTAAGTYTYDVVATDGIVYETSGTIPTSTITTR